PDFAAQMNLEILPITAAEASSFHKLPRLSHKDPFDRIIIWQAIQRKMTLVSKDHNFKAYHKFGLITFW
ncbi:MAG: PIN domain-containing protein, partial [Deltaproteobacteria bacterium]|nr:PIN domain-containing protein [Deltaproteobacteria bacterium]